MIIMIITITIIVIIIIIIILLLLLFNIQHSLAFMVLSGIGILCSEAWYFIMKKNVFNVK